MEKHPLDQFLAAIGSTRYQLAKKTEISASGLGNIIARGTKVDDLKLDVLKGLSELSGLGIATISNDLEKLENGVEPNIAAQLNNPKRSYRLGELFGILGYVIDTYMPIGMQRKWTNDLANLFVKPATLYKHYYLRTVSESVKRHRSVPYQRLLDQQMNSLSAEEFAAGGELDQRSFFAGMQLTRATMSTQKNRENQSKYSAGVVTGDAAKALAPKDWKQPQDQ